MNRWTTAAILIAIALGPASALAQDDADSDLTATYSEKVGESNTLTQLLEYAEDNAPALREARKRVEVGDAAIEGARKFQPFNPELEGEMNLGLTDAGLKKTEVVFKQRFEIAGERGLRIESARKRKKILKSQLARAEWDVHERVHGLYRTGLVDRERIEIEREILEFTRELVTIARTRFESGEEPKTSLVVARAEVATARQRLVEAWLGYIRTLRDLGETIGWEKDDPPQPTGELHEAKATPEDEELVEKALEYDPQLKLLHAHLERQRAKLTLDRRGVQPNPIVGVGWEGENFDGDTVGHSIKLVVGLPLPIWNRNQGKIAADQARIRVIREKIANRKKTLKTRVRKQAAAVQSAYEQTRIYEEEVLPALETQLELLREGFKLGEMNLLDVMSARDRLLAVQRQHLDALEEYFVAVSELEKLLGTSIWESEEH